MNPIFILKPTASSSSSGDSQRRLHVRTRKSDFRCSCKCCKLLFFFLLLYKPFQGACEEVTRITVGSLRANCYILTNEKTKEAVIIDPGDEGQKILLHLTSRGLRVAGILATHAHRDHLAACEDLQEVTGSPVRIHRAGLKKAKSLCPKVRFVAIDKDGPLRIGPFDLEVIHTPGHTPGSICVKWKDRLFSGDTLFLKSVGKSTQLKILVNSIQEKLWCLPDRTKVYPGHGNFTSIGFEKQHNPFVPKAPTKILKLDEALEFIELWYICGPFTKKGSKELLARWTTRKTQQAPPERFFQERYPTKTESSGWVPRKIEIVEMPSAHPITGELRPLETRIIDFLDAFPDASVDSSAYALAFLESEKEQTRTILVGSDDGITVWLNGKEIHRSQKTRPIVPDEDFMIARFKPGLNALLVEVTNARGYWGFMLRLSGTGKAPPPPLPIDQFFP